MDTARRFRSIRRRDSAGSGYPKRRLPPVQAGAPAPTGVGRAGVPACLSPKLKLLDQIRTEEAYVGWIKRFILFHHKQHPAEMGKPEIEQFLTALAVERRVAASTQNQTTMISAHVLNRGGHGVQSPADRLLAGASGVLARGGKPHSTPGGENHP